MSMFENYENNSYTAYNITPRKISTLTQRYFHSPIVGYDEFGNIKAFMWDPEDQFNLNLNLGVKIKVFDDSIIYSNSGQKPDSSVQGVKGQRAYNIVDCKSWLCKGTLSDTINDGDWIPIENIDNLPEWEQIDKLNFNLSNDSSSDLSSLSDYVWEEDTLLTFSEDGTKEIIIQPDMSGKVLQITLMNFRHEIIYSYEFENQNSCSIQIGSKTTNLLVEGQFYINVYIKDSESIQQQNQYPITIVENPYKYVKGNDVLNNALYISGDTIQSSGNTTYVWEPLGNVDNDYVWIPISINNTKFLTYKGKMT